MKTFNIESKDYYFENQTLYKNNNITFEENKVTCLVGCNGIGKSTLLEQLIQDNDTSLNKYAYNLGNDYNGHIDFSSWFEDIVKKKEDYSDYYIIGNKDSDFTSTESDSMLEKLISTGMSTGESNVYFMAPVFNIMSCELKNLKDKTVYILIDDLDVGVSVDVLVEEVALIKRMEKALKDNNVTYYIIITANSYELCRHFNCIDSVSLKPVTFTDYDDYVKYVCKTRKYKDSRNREKKKKVKHEEKKK